MTRIQLRHGTDAEWTAANPVLLLGEAAFSKDINALKVGDGLTAWASLPYFSDALRLLKSANLSDLASAAAARTNLGLGSAALSAASAFEVAGASTKEAGVATKTADYTLVLGDAGFLIILNLATAINLFIPTNASVAFPVGTRIDGLDIGAGQATIKAVTAGTTTVLSTGATPAQPKSRAQYSGFSLVKAGTDLWYVMGDIS